MYWTADDIIKASSGELICGNRNSCFSGIGIDSRKISSNDFFVAIRGAVHDGHRFCQDVTKAGVKGILIDIAKANDLPVAEWRQNETLCIGVKDTTRALGDLAAYHRNRFPVSVIAITGSNGKTTTRSMTSEIMAQRFSVLATTGNQNNHIGLPLTLLGLNKNHEWAVLELGMNHSGEIERLSEICRPDICVITMIGTAHLENFSSQDGILEAKAEIFRHMQQGGSAVLNIDDMRLLNLSRRLSSSVFFFGTNPKASVRARHIQNRQSGVSFFLEMPQESIQINLHVTGAFMVVNALAAAAVGSICGLSGIEIKSGLENFRPIKGRMNIIKTEKNIYLVDDTYNANPTSMAASIASLAEIKGRNRGFLVLGDMLELGNNSQAFHREIGELAATSGMTALYAAGEFSAFVAEGALSKGMNASCIMTGNLKDIFTHLKDRLKEDDWVLVKGSRAMGMEEIVYEIKTWADKTA